MNMDSKQAEIDLLENALRELSRRVWDTEDVRQFAWTALQQLKRMRQVKGSE